MYFVTTILIIILTSSKGETEPPAENCPVLCDCSDDFLIITCKVSKSLKLKLPMTTKELHLQKDYIGPIQNDTINRLVNLEILDFSFNNINYLQSGVFQYMEQLKWISLRGNILTYIDDDIFQDNRKLEYLDLSHNLFRFIPDASIRVLSNLNVFNMSYNSLVFAKLSVRFQVTTKLKVMDFSGNSLGFISSDDLDIMNGWESRVPKVLNYSHCNLRVIDAEAVKHVKNLEYLVLSHNVNLEVTNLTEFLSAAQEVSLRKLDLSYTNLSNKINTTDLTSENLGGLAIEELYLAGNHFKEIDDNALTYLTLKRLDLSNNSISSISAGLAQLTNLKYLDLSLNSISSVNDAFKNSLANMETLLLSHNILTEESNLDLSAAVKLIDLDLSSNSFGSFSIPRELVKLKVINIAGNKLGTLNNNEPLFGLESLIEIDLQNNELTSLVAFMFRDSPNLMDAHFGRNKIVDVSHQAFVPHCPKYLDLSYNNITNLRHFGWHGVMVIKLGHNKITEVEPQTFYFLDSLQELYLNNNNISSVDVDLLTHLTNLTDLSLRNNHLGDSDLLHDLLRPLPELRAVDIGSNEFSEMNGLSVPFSNNLELVKICMGDNKLKFLKPDIFTSLEKIEVVDFSGNPFQCDCELLPLQSWAQKTPIRVEGKENFGYRCKSPGYRNGKTLFNFTVRTFECNQYLFYVVVFSSVGGGAIILAVVIATVCHLWLKHRRKKKIVIDTAKPDLVGYKAMNGAVPTGKASEVNGTEMTLRENYPYNLQSDTLIDVEYENPVFDVDLDNYDSERLEKKKEKKPVKKKADKERSNEKKKQKIKKLQSDLKKYEKLLKEVRFQKRHGSDNNVDLGYLDLSSAERKERHRKSANKNHRRANNNHHSDDELIERKRRPRGNKDLVRMLSSRHYKSMPDVVNYVNSLSRRAHKGYPYSRIPIIHVDHPDRAHRGWVRSLIDIPRGRPSGGPHDDRHHYENLKYALTHRPPGGYHRMVPHGYHTISSGYRKPKMERPDLEETFTKSLGRSLGRKYFQSTSGLSVWV